MNLFTIILIGALNGLLICFMWQRVTTLSNDLHDLDRRIYRLSGQIQRLEHELEDHLMASKPHKPLQLQIDDLRKIVIGDAGQITIEESDEPESEDDDDAESEEAVYIPCDTKASKTFKILDPKKDKPIC